MILFVKLHGSSMVLQLVSLENETDVFYSNLSIHITYARSSRIRRPSERIQLRLQGRPMDIIQDT